MFRYQSSLWKNKIYQKIKPTNFPNQLKFPEIPAINSKYYIIQYIHVISTFISSSVHPLTLVRCVLSGDVRELSTSRPPRRCGCGTTLVEVHSITLMCDICSNVGGIDLAKTQIYGILFSPYYCYCTAKKCKKPWRLAIFTAQTKDAMTTTTFFSSKDSGQFLRTWTKGFGGTIKQQS